MIADGVSAVHQPKRYAPDVKVKRGNVKPAATIFATFCAALIGVLVGVSLAPTYASSISNGGGATAAATSVITMANEGGTGTTLNKLARITGAPATAILGGVSDFDGIIGVVSAGAGTTGNATITTAGIALCIFENATTAGNFVIPGTSVAGDCRDSGTSLALPVSTQGVQLIGIVLTTNGGAGTYSVQFMTPSRTTTKFRGGAYLSGGISGLIPCNNDNIQGFAAGGAIFNWTATGLLIQPQGAACATASGPLDVEGGTVGTALTTQGANKLIGPGGPQNGNNSSATGGVGGPITITGGQGGGFSAGSGSTAGVGGSVSITAGQGGAANSGSTNGAGGDVSITPGAAGGGAGTASVQGNINLRGHAVAANTSPSIDSGSLVTGSTDVAGKVNSATTGAFTGTITFGKVWARAPACTVTNETTANLARAASTTTAVAIIGVTVSGDVLAYHCFGY